MAGASQASSRRQTSCHLFAAATAPLAEARSLRRRKIKRQQKGFRREVSILGPLGYGPSTLPLRHAESMILKMEHIEDT